MQYSLSEIYSGKELPIHLCNHTSDFTEDFLLQKGQGKWKKILVLGESPALNGRIQSKRAFYTIQGKIVASGKRFNTLFEEFGFGIEDVSFTELCKCVVGPKRGLLKTCSPHRWAHLLSQISVLQPKLIIVLGKHTTDLFSQLCGEKLEMGHIQSAILAQQSYKVLPIYHPSPMNPHSLTRNKDIIERQKDILKEMLSNGE